MRKFFKVLGYIMGFFLLLVVGVLIYFAISSKIYIGRADPSFVNYLSANKYSVGEENDLAIIDSAMVLSQVILLGEIHGFADNQVLDKYLLLHASKKYGVRNYIGEMDSATAATLNRFLHLPQRDTALLYEFVRQMRSRIPQQAGKELAEKWDEIYAYNRNLPDSLKITVWGIDRNKDDTAISREAAMANNLLRLLQQPGWKTTACYGIFGLFHVLQGPIKNTDMPLAARLKQAGVEVTSIASYSLNSEMFLPKDLGIPAPNDERTTLVNADGPLMLVKGIRDLEAAAQNSKKTIFKLNSKNSPYDHSQQLATVKSSVFGENLFPATDTIPTTQYFQYVVLHQDGKAIQPLIGSNK